MMSKLDYEHIARILASQKPNSGQALATWKELVKRLADNFAARNARFDRQRFYLATAYMTWSELQAAAQRDRMPEPYHPIVTQEVKHE